MARTTLKRRRHTNVLIILFMILFSFLCIYPFYYILVLSLNDATDAMRGGIYWWPREISLASYKTVFRNQYLFNSFLISVARVLIMSVLVPLVCSLYAYALCLTELPGRKFFRWILVIPMYVGGGIIPFYLLLREMHLTDTFWVYIIPYIFGSYNVLLFRSFFSGVPGSLRESALLDGANELVVFFKIIFPVSIPVFAAVALFTAVGNWNEWMVGQLFVADSKLYPMATVLLQIIRSTNSGGISGVSVSQLIGSSSDRVTPESVRYAMIVVTTLPILLVYPLLQKYFIHGIMIGSVKE